MMRYPEMWVPLFKDGTEKEREFSLFAMRELLESLVKINVGWIHTHPTEFVPLYKLGVKWQPENNTERWLSIPAVISAHRGPDKQPVDCEDLACYRVAELRAGLGGHPLGAVRAVADVRGRVLTGGRIIVHAFVRYPDGSVEDPSKKLGMPGEGADVVERRAPAKLVSLLKDMRRAA
jgi:hypothetical protein